MFTLYHFTILNNPTNSHPTITTLLIFNFAQVNQPSHNTKTLLLQYTTSTTFYTSTFSSLPSTFSPASTPLMSSNPSPDISRLPPMFWQALVAELSYSDIRSASLVSKDWRKNILEATPHLPKVTAFGTVAKKLENLYYDHYEDIRYVEQHNLKGWAAERVSSGKTIGRTLEYDETYGAEMLH